MQESYVLVLDFLPGGYAGERRPEPVAQAIGEEFFSLLELVIKEGEKINPGDRLELRADKRIKFIKRKLSLQDLTNMARSALGKTIEEIINKHEHKFVNFFNHATMVTPRMHQFELLPGIGKKHVGNILKERSIKPFESFEDIEKRVKLMTNPIKIIKKRILEEMEGNEKYYVFGHHARPHRRY